MFCPLPTKYVDLKHRSLRNVLRRRFAGRRKQLNVGIARPKTKRPGKPGREFLTIFTKA
jgi:hypothetical protein